MSVVMGIDASTTCTGISIFNNKNLVHSTEIRAKSDEWHQRLIEQKDQIEEIIKKYEPIMAYMEDVPLESRSSKNLLLLGAVHGFIFDICVNFDIEIEYISPTVWRSRLNMFDGTKDGRKREVLKEKAILMANKLFNLKLEWHGPKSKKTQDDQAEAILIAWSKINNK